MPTIEISKSDLLELIGKKLGDKELEEALELAKSGIDSAEGDLLKIEVGDVNRPDLWSAEGLARELKLRLGIEKKEYEAKSSGCELKVDSKVKKARPFIACAVVKNLNLNDSAIKSIIQLQEKLCESFGLKRKEVAIGVYDFEKIKWPITYTTFIPSKLSFVPLGASQELTLKEILQQHEKGIQYAGLLEHLKEYPVLIDAEKRVLSMPPIINSEHSGKVTEETKNVFVEATGFSERFVIPALNIIICALADRGGTMESVSITDGKKRVTPDLKRKGAEVNIDEANNILGLNLIPRQISSLLEKAGFETKQSGKKLSVTYPAYRQDILDSRDVIEDIAISYGYGNFLPIVPEVFTIGKFSEETELREKVSGLITGLGVQEIATFTLTNRDELFKKMKMKAKEALEIANPVSATYSSVRSWLLPSLLEFLSKNKDEDYPQKIFEIGKCIEIINGEADDKLKLAFATAEKKAGFTETRQMLEWLAASLGIEIKIVPCEHESFIAGRVGKIIVHGREAGILGEISPAVLSEWNISMPVAGFELDLTELK